MVPPSPLPTRLLCPASATVARRRRVIVQVAFDVPLDRVFDYLALRPLPAPRAGAVCPRKLVGGGGWQVAASHQAPLLAVLDEPPPLRTTGWRHPLCRALPVIRWGNPVHRPVHCWHPPRRWPCRPGLSEARRCTRQRGPRASWRCGPAAAGEAGATRCIRQVCCAPADRWRRLAQVTPAQAP